MVLELKIQKMQPLLSSFVKDNGHPVREEVAPRVKRKGRMEEQKMEEYLVILLSWLMRKKVWETLISLVTSLQRCD